MRDEKLVKTLEEDIDQLIDLAGIYAKKKKFDRATECLKEREELEEMLKQELDKPVRELEDYE